MHDAWYRSREVRLTIGGVDETLGWQFDALDNIVARTSSLAEGAHGLTGAFTYGDAGPNAVTAAGELTLEYDAAGRVSRRGDLAMTWDDQGRLTRMGDDVAHVYGADQTRVLTAARGSVTHYALPDFDVRDGITSLYVRIGRQRIARLDSAGLATMLMTDHNGNDRIDAGDALLAQDQEDENSDAEIDRFLWSAVRRQHLDRGAETTHLHADQQGTLTLATVDGEAVGRRGFLPTGESRGDDVGFVDVYGFTGQEGPEDPRDPLIHFQFRWLDPALGRWGSPDPLFAAASAGRLGLFGESTTAYAYVANGFFDHTDPTGLGKEHTAPRASSALPGKVPGKAQALLGLKPGAGKAVEQANQVRQQMRRFEPVGRQARAEGMHLAGDVAGHHELASGSALRNARTGVEFARSVATKDLAAGGFSGSRARPLLDAHPHVQFYQGLHEGVMARTREAGYFREASNARALFSESPYQMTPSNLRESPYQRTPADVSESGAGHETSPYNNLFDVQQMLHAESSADRDVANNYQNVREVLVRLHLDAMR